MNKRLFSSCPQWWSVLRRQGAVSVFALILLIFICMDCWMSSPRANCERCRRTVQPPEREHPCTDGVPACPRLCLPALLPHGRAPQAAINSAPAGKGCLGSRAHTDDFWGIRGHAGGGQRARALQHRRRAAARALRKASQGWRLLQVNPLADFAVSVVRQFVLVS